MFWVVFFDVDPFVSNNVTQASGKLTSKIQFTPGLHILIRDKEIIRMSYQHKLLDGCNDTKQSERIPHMNITCRKGQYVHVGRFAFTLRQTNKNNIQKHIQMNESTPVKTNNRIGNTSFP